MKLFQVMASNKLGGAELFFCRLAQSFQEHSLKQAVLLRKDNPYANQLSTITQYSAPFSGSFDFKTNSIIQKILYNWQPDIVLTYMNRASGMVGKCYRSKNYQHVARLGGYYNLKYYRHCNHFIGNSQGICDYLLKQGVPIQRVHLISNFVTETHGKPLPRPHYPLLVALGRLHTNKAFDILIRAMADVPDTMLWIVGVGPEQKRLLRLIIELGLQQRIKLYNWTDKPEDFIASCDIFICPSRHEPLGSIYLEAWAQGKPIIATRNQGAIELINDTENGLLVDVDDAKQLAQKINELVRDKNAQKQLAISGQKKYHQCFSRQIITKQYLELWSHLLTNASS